MKFQEIQELIKLINTSDLSEFKLKDGEFELSIRTKHYVKAKQASATNGAQQPVVAMPPLQQSYPSTNPAPTAASPGKAASQSDPNQEAPAEAADESEDHYVPIKSPIVGTFYRSPSPEKEAYVKVGDVIEAGSVVCIVEAMKLFNEIESDVAGKIVKVMVEDAQPVEYDQALFLVDPAG